MTKERCPIFINPAKRSFKIDNVLGALVFTGSDKVSNHFGNGDCILCDLPHRLFAVADASERFPRASRQLLKRLHRYLSQADANQKTGENLKHYVARAYKRQPYLHRSTFSCVAVEETAINENGNGGFKTVVTVSHGGDSSVCILDRDCGEIVFATKSDMNFAGRSKWGPQSQTIRLKNGNYRIILSTDGLFDLSKHLNNGRFRRFPEFIIDNPPHGIMDRLLEEMALLKAKTNWDDMSILAFDLKPLKQLAAGSCLKDSILMGGSLPNEEHTYFKLSDLEESNAWQPVEFWKTRQQSLKAAGIRLM